MSFPATSRAARPAILALTVILSLPGGLLAQRTVKPVLHGRHWVAITGKPLGATAGAMMFQKGGNAVDAAAAMIAATATMWDVLSWGGETQALIWNPVEKKVIAINALGFAPTGATPAYYHSKGLDFPPEYGPLAAVTPGTPGGILTMLANWGRLSLADVLAPAIRDGRWLPDRGADRQLDREQQGVAEAVALLEGDHAAAPRRGARGAVSR